MKERPILLKTDMVQATLEDKKTNTRRVIKLPFEHDNYKFHGFTGIDYTYAIFTEKNKHEICS